MTNEEKNRITVEIVLGMRYIHSKDLMHRDLKPENILLSKNKHARISDFGLAKEESLETSQTKGVGSLRFMAPELFEESEPERYDNKVDVYSFGIVLIFIISEQYPPFSLQDRANGILPVLPTTIVPWVTKLIHQCLDKSPSQRPTFNDIFHILQSHDYDLFNALPSTKPTAQQRISKEEIERRILKIEAFEYQHRI